MKNDGNSANAYSGGCACAGTETHDDNSVRSPLIPLIPHTLDGRADCLLCHKTGEGGAPTVPADHAGRTNDICQTCHKVKT